MTERQHTTPLEDLDLVAEVSDEQARDAYAKEDKRLFTAWYLQEQDHAEEDATGARGILLDIKLARLKHGAGDHEDAAKTLEEAIQRVQHHIVALESGGGDDRSARLETLRELEDQMWTFLMEIKGERLTQS